MKPFKYFSRFPILLLSLSLTFFLTQSVYAGTCVSGLQSGVWSSSGSPYIIVGGVTVPEGETLRIEPGTVILISPQKSGFGGAFRVEGTLIAQGLPTRRIIFSALDLESLVIDPNNPEACSGREKKEPGVWVGLQFFTPGPGSILLNCDIRYAGRDGSPSISISGTGIEDTNLTISSCRITDGDGEGILMNSGASPLILNTLVENHAETGIVELAPSCHPVVRGCSSKSNGGYAVEAFAGNVRNYDRLFIAGNQTNAFRITSEPITASGEWLDHGAPYHYNRGDQFAIPVREGITLTLEPGVELQMGANRGFDIAGTLIADADSCRRITFIAIDTMAPWGRLDFNGAAAKLNYVDYSYGKSLRLRNVENRVEVSNCRITRSTDKGLEISGDSEPLIRNNLISGHSEEGVWLSTTTGFQARFRLNRISGNREGMRLFSTATTADLGALTDPGHNAFLDNSNYALFHQGADTVFAFGNYWVATDSATIDAEYIYDDDESAASGPVIFVPFDESDLSAPPTPGICPPSCEALSVSILQPTSAATFTTSARFLPLGGSAVDDRGVDIITWSNTATGESGEAGLLPPLTECEWNTAPILLLPGTNLITVTATDQDGCTATDELVVTYDEDAAGCWLADSFDDLQDGLLDGQSGWNTVPGRTSAEVIANPFAAGQLLRLDPSTDEPIIMEKTVSAQAEGTHVLELLVLAEPGDTSMAKIEVKTSGNPAWDKKFQLYFGQIMRLNYGPTQPEAVDFLAPVEAGRWYHVSARIDLATDLVDIYLDGVQVLDSIAVGPGPIEEVSLSGWNFPGFVLYDDLRGCPAEPVVSTPLPGETFTGLRLWPNYPNPFVEQTTITFELSYPTEVTLSVHDLWGREITTLINARLPAGTHQVDWNGHGPNGRLLPTGIYLYSLRAGTTVQTRRMVLGKQ